MSSTSILKAAKIAFQSHSGQLDKAGKPYFNHPLAVAIMVAKSGVADDQAIEAAFLHDVVEDTGTTLDEIAAEGFSSDVLDALRLLTRKPGVDYMDYVRQIAGKPELLYSARAHEIARLVKVADLSHNMDLSRLPAVTEKDLARAEKYKKARILCEPSAIII